MEQELACEKCRTVEDVLQDKEAFDNDQLRRVYYEDQGYGDDHSYTITTAPVRLASMGDPILLCGSTYARERVESELRFVSCKC